MLLGIRPAHRPDFKMSIAETVLGQELSVPGQLVVKDLTSLGEARSHPFFRKVDELLESRKTFPRQGETPSHSIKALNSAEYVFVRDDTVKKPLVKPYRGPFRVLSHTKTAFEILNRGKSDFVSTDRLKPAFIEKI